MRAKIEPDLCIEVHEVNDSKGTGMIYSRTMKCEFPSKDIAGDVAKLIKEWQMLREAYL